MKLVKWQNLQNGKITPAKSSEMKIEIWKSKWKNISWDPYSDPGVKLALSLLAARPQFQFFIQTKEKMNKSLNFSLRFCYHDFSLDITVWKAYTFYKKNYEEYYNNFLFRSLYIQVFSLSYTFCLWYCLLTPYFT